MQHIANQLNKVKSISEKEGRSRDHDMSADSTSDLLKSVDGDQRIEGKRIAVFNAKSGILPIGLSFLSPLLIISISSKHPSNIFNHNLQQFGVACDVVVTTTSPFLQDALDIGIVGPTLDRSKSTDLSLIMQALKMCRTVYAVFMSEHRKLVLRRFNEVSVVGNLYIKLPGSSNYYKQKNDAVQFEVFKIRS